MPSPMGRVYYTRTTSLTFSSPSKDPLAVSWGNVSVSLWPWGPGTGLCARRHVGGEDVVGVAVQVLACPVVAHGGARVGVPSGDLDIPQVDSGVQHRGHERVPQHVRMHPR